MFLLKVIAYFCSDHFISVSSLGCVPNVVSLQSWGGGVRVVVVEARWFRTSRSRKQLATINILNFLNCGFCSTVKLSCVLPARIQQVFETGQVIRRSFNSRR